MAPEAQATIEQLARAVARRADAEGALARIQAAALARALGAPAIEAVEPLRDDDRSAASLLPDAESWGRFYELLQGHLRPAERRALGQYFTPRPIAAAMWSVALAALDRLGARREAVRVIDPALGSGAFLLEGLRRGLDGPQMIGVEILPSAARTARVNLCLEASAARRGVARLLEGDAYAPAIEDALVEHARAGEAVLVIGNPPYNGTSPLLKDPPRLRSARERLLPFAAYHAPHSGFRDDFAYFFGLAHRLLERAERPGAICFITPSSLLDARDYLGLRRFLVERYDARFIDVGPAAFPDARVATCISVLATGRPGARYAALPLASRESALARIGRDGDPEYVSLAPAAPDHALRPSIEWAELEERVDPVTSVLQRWFTPHKTGFDELLVDPDPEQIWERLRALASAGFDLAAFVARFGPAFDSPRVKRKLAAVRDFARAEPSFPTRARIQPYLRYNPGRARFAAPREQWQHCYFEPRIATLFNHAFCGTIGRFKPHEQKPQLLFNTFESPLYAMVVEKPGVLHLYQHARFAPLHVPEGCWQARETRSIKQDAGAMVLNLTPAWRERAALLRQPDDLFHLLAGIYQSALMQRVFAPAFGKRRPLPVRRFDAKQAKVAQRIADRARLFAAMEARDQPADGVQRWLDLDVLRLYLGDDLDERALAERPLARAALGSQERDNSVMLPRARAPKHDATR